MAYGVRMEADEAVLTVFGRADRSNPTLLALMRVTVSRFAQERKGRWVVDLSDAPSMTRDGLLPILLVLGGAAAADVRPILRDPPPDVLALLWSVGLHKIAHIEIDGKLVT